MKLASAYYEGSIHPFDSMGFTNMGGLMDPDQLKGADALVVWGGEDISPSLYKSTNNSRTWAPPRPSRRDAVEWALMNKAVELGIPIIGVCRGAQMLCALSGGTLYQHVNHHTGGGHSAIDNNGVIVRVSSLHHQMMNPTNTDHEMVQWSEHRRSDVYYAEAEEPTEAPEKEPEYIYFPKTRGHAIQWHPEYMNVDCDANNWLRTLWQDRGIVW